MYNIGVCMHVCKYVRTYVCMYVDMHVYTHMNDCVYVYEYYIYIFL